MSNFQFKVYYNSWISPTTNSVWGVVCIGAKQPLQPIIPDAPPHDADLWLHLWTPAGARIVSLAQAYPHWVKDQVSDLGDRHTWIVPVPPIAVGDHRDYVIHIELANVGAKILACKPSVSYRTGEERIEEKGDQAAWMILQQTNNASQYNNINPIVSGYLGQGQLDTATRAMTEALSLGDLAAAERHRTEALMLAKATGNRPMTKVLESAETIYTSKTVALETRTIDLTGQIAE